MWNEAIGVEGASLLCASRLGGLDCRMPGMLGATGRCERRLSVPPDMVDATITH